MANRARKINPYQNKSIIVADNKCNHIIKKYSLFTVPKNRPQMQSHRGTEVHIDSWHLQALYAMKSAPSQNAHPAPAA